MPLQRLGKGLIGLLSVGRLMCAVPPEQRVRDSWKQERGLESIPSSRERPWRYRDSAELLGQLLAMVQGRDSAAQGVCDEDIRYISRYGIKCFFTFARFLRRPSVFSRISGCGARRRPVSMYGARLGPGRAPWHVLWTFKVAELALFSRYCVPLSRVAQDL